MWLALIEALSLAQTFLTRFYGGYGMPTIGRTSTKRTDWHKLGLHTEAIAEIITLTRSKPFRDLCRKYWLEPTSDDVAAQPAMYRAIIALARQLRSQNRRH
jgi:hypothetical protein